jgi:dihydrofolate reductase
MEISMVFPFEKDIPDIRDMSGAHPFSLGNSSTGRRRELRAVVAAGLGGEIGFGGDMPWHIPEDLRHFRQLTVGHPVIMGRATWLSLPRRPLPGRRNIVLSRDPGFRAEGAETAASVEEAIAMCPPPEIPYIIGGGKVYEAAMPWLTRIDLTRVEARFPEADTFFPELQEQHWIMTGASETLVSSCGLSFRFETYESSDN